MKQKQSLTEASEVRVGRLPQLDVHRAQVDRAPDQRAVPLHRLHSHTKKMSSEL
jgi:hypothetical protein